MDPQSQPDQTPAYEPDLGAPEPAERDGIFIGPNGLRAGWKFAIFLIAVILCMALSIPLAMRLIPHPKTHAFLSLRVQLPIELIQALCTLFVTAVMARWIDRKPWSYFGMPWKDAFRLKFWAGAGAGFAALALQLELMHLGGWFDYGPRVLHGGEVLKYAALWGVLFLGTGFFEEAFLRGYPQRVLTDGMTFWGAALLLSIIFALAHTSNGGENAFGIFMVFVDGMLMCWCLWRTGNMWFGIGCHAAWDWAQTFFFGVPDSGMKASHALLSPSFHGPALLSGGSAGPEGSVLVILSEALIGIFVAFAYRGRRYPLPSDTPLESPFSSAALVSGEPAQSLEGGS